jgi:hypothetical protein
MRCNSRAFVSYTRRDGQVTRLLLDRLSENLTEICLPFIHCVHSAGGRWEQLSVLINLARSHMLLLIESPLVHRSPWVSIELLISRLLLIPVVRLPVEALKALAMEDNHCMHSDSELGPLRSAIPGGRCFRSIIKDS